VREPFDMRVGHARHRGQTGSRQHNSRQIVSIGPHVAFAALDSGVHAVMEDQRAKQRRN